MPVRSFAAFAALLLSLTACTAAPPAMAPAPAPTLSAQAHWVQQMLLEAEQALEDNRLMLPAGNNAYDRYRQILDMEPENAAAAAGIKRIGRRYLILANEAASAGELTVARRYIARAQQIEPDYEAVAHMTRYVDSLQAAQHRQREAAGRRAVRLLEAADLTARNAAMVSRLQAIALEVRAADSRFEIIARSDPEGRWIYQTMREASPDYRLRASFERGSPPRIVLIDVQE